MTNPPANGASHATTSKPAPRPFTFPTDLSRIQPTSRTKRPFTAGDIERFRAICAQQTDKADYPNCAAVVSNAVIYDAAHLRAVTRGPQEERDALMAELHRCLLQGPGVYAITGAYSDLSVVDAASAAFSTIIEREKASGTAKGDHFAKAGTNDRIWNSFQKHAEVDPASFVEYYANEMLALACESWLGPGYQVTAQTNVVKPGGRAQQPHRDYHLGFQDEPTAARFPIVSQIASQLLTLQGAVAHTDMPLASGPTQLLPYSQHYDYGFQAYRHQAFHDVFHEHMVQVPLRKGDMLFFNPALFHAAGDNDTAVDRAANLVQISACWGKAMESVDRAWIVRHCWNEIRAFCNGTAKRKAHVSEIQALVAAVCDGYSFPTNLDKDPPPPDGHCPPTQKDLVEEALAADVDQAQITNKLEAYAQKRLP